MKPLLRLWRRLTRRRPVPVAPRPTPRPPRALAQERRAADPAFDASLQAAHLAYHATPPEAGAHHFGDHWGDPDYRHRPCLWCGRTRWDVRHSGAAPECTGRPDVPGTIRHAEEQFIALLKRAPRIVAKHAPDPAALDGATLATLQHTHGLLPETVEAAYATLYPETHEHFQFPEAVHAEFSRAMEAHRLASTPEAA